MASSSRYGLSLLILPKCLHSYFSSILGLHFASGCHHLRLSIWFLPALCLWLTDKIKLIVLVSFIFFSPQEKSDFCFCKSHQTILCLKHAVCVSVHVKQSPNSNYKSPLWPPWLPNLWLLLPLSAVQPKRIWCRYLKDTRFSSPKKPPSVLSSA